MQFASVCLMLRYTKDAPELQLRRLADLAFLFQMYDFSYNTYHTAKKDFNNDQAWLHFAGALVCLLVFVLLVVSNRFVLMKFFK